MKKKKKKEEKYPATTFSLLVVRLRFRLLLQVQVPHPHPWSWSYSLSKLMSMFITMSPTAPGRNGSVAVSVRSGPRNNQPTGLSRLRECLVALYRYCTSLTRSQAMLCALAGRASMDRFGSLRKKILSWPGLNRGYDSSGPGRASSELFGWVTWMIKWTAMWFAVHDRHDAGHIWTHQWPDHDAKMMMCWYPILVWIDGWMERSG